MAQATNLPDDDNVEGFFFGAYISHLRKAGSYHWYSRQGSLQQVRDYVWDLMDIREEHLAPGGPSTKTLDGSLEFIGVESSAGAVVTCFWMNDAGIDVIQSAVRREWEAMKSELQRGVFLGLPWDVRNTLMMFGEIDAQNGSPELYDFLQDGSITSLREEDE